MLLDTWRRTSGVALALWRPTHRRLAVLHMGRATIRLGLINLLNTIVGAGILAMPYGLAANGMAFGVLLIVWLSATSAFGLYLQNKVAKYTGQQDAVLYFSLCQLTYPQLSVIFDAAIAIKCFGVGVSYLVVIGDLMPQIMAALHVLSLWLLHRNVWITLFMALMVTPLSYLKRLDSLKYTLVVALFSVGYLICLVVEHYVVDTLPARELDLWGPLLVRLTLALLPIFVFAYTCHQNMFAIINELRSTADAGLQTRQANWVIRNAIGVACALYLVVGVVGYLLFGRGVSGNIITMYPRSSVLLLVGRLCIVVMVSLLFPLQCHPCRGLVNHIVHFVKHGVAGSRLRNLAVTLGGYTLLADLETEAETEESFVSTTPMEGAQDTDGHDPIIVPLTSRNFYLITTVIVAASYAVAVTVTSLTHVLAIVGSTGSTSISFILPGLFGYMLICPDGPLTLLERFCKYGGLALSVWGVLVMVVCLTVTFTS